MQPQLTSALSLLLLCSAFLLTSCVREPSDSVDQDKIFTELELFYNANEDLTYVRATFKFSNIFGTRLELVEPSEISFDGEVLVFDQGLAYYQKTLAGFVPGGEFIWKDTEGNSFTNTISINEIDFPASLDTIARDAAFELHWAGTPLGADENLTLTASSENGAEAQVFITNITGSNSMVLGKNKLELVGQGNGTLSLDRRYQPALQEATGAGGLLTGRYRPENINVYFE
jgi:hypothetical protein